MEETDRIDVRETSPAISDSGKVKIGNFTPLFPTPLRDAPSNVGDSGKVRVGNFTPAFPPIRTR